MTVFSTYNLHRTETLLYNCYRVQISSRLLQLFRHRFITKCLLHIYVKQYQLFVGFKNLVSVSNRVLLLTVGNKVWSNDTIPTLPLIFPNTVYPTLDIYTHQSFGCSFICGSLSLGCRSAKSWFNPSHIHPLSTPPSPSLSLTCPGSVKGKVFVWEMAVWRVKRMRRTDTYYKHMQAYMHTFTNKHRHILREAAVWWTALAFGRRHDKVVERSGRERRRVAHWMERWRGVKGIREGNVKDQCHQDCGPVFVSVATYHSIVCLLRTRQCAERVWRGVGWGLVRVRLWISKGKVGERGWGETHGSAIYNIGGGVRLGEGLCVFVCVCCIQRTLL